MTYTEEQLKLALVKAMPDRLCISKGFGNLMWHPPEMGALVTEHEWPAIVGMAFARWLDEGDRDFAQYSFFSPIATWQEVAAYLSEIGAIKVETP